MQDNTNENSLALELLKELKSQSKRWFILAIIGWLVCFVTNAIWLYAWNLPVTETSEIVSYDLDSQDDGNAMVNDEGEVNINNGKDKENN